MSETETQETQQTEEPKTGRGGLDAARAAVLAEMEAGAESAKGENPPAEPVAEPAAEEAAEETVEAKPAADDAGGDEVEAQLDPETAKRVASIQRAEKRSRELLAKERAEIAELKAEIERERSGLAAQLEEAKAFAQLKARARYAPADVLAALGLTEDDYEPAARDLYSRSKAAAQDPKTKEAALKMQREREYADKVAGLERKLQEMEQRDAQRAQEQQYQAAWQSYYGDVTKAVGDDAPLLKTAMAKAPAKTQEAIRATAVRMCQELGEWPDAVDVIATYEKQRRAELEELGIDLSSAKSESAGEKRVSKTVSPGTAKASTPPPKAKRTRQEDKEEVLRALESGKLE